MKSSMSRSINTANNRNSMAWSSSTRALTTSVTNKSPRATVDWEMFQLNCCEDAWVSMLYSPTRKLATPTSCFLELVWKRTQVQWWRTKPLGEKENWFSVGRQWSNPYLSECHDEELRDLPQEMNRVWRRTFDYQLHDHRDQKRYAGQYSAQAHFLQRPTDADAFEHRVDGVFEERNADENEQRVDHLKLVSFELIGSNLAIHGLALQDPSGALLIVERPEEWKWDEQIQNVEQDLALVDELLAVLCNRVIEPVIARHHATFSSSRGGCILAEKDSINYSLQVFKFHESSLRCTSRPWRPCFLAAAPFGTMGDRMRK